MRISDWSSDVCSSDLVCSVNNTCIIIMKFLTNAVFAFLMISIHAVVAPAIAQDGGPKITGTLLGMLPDGTMEPLAGGTVTWIGTQISIGSDDNGRFELSTAGVTDERLVASFTGYRIDTIDWEGGTELTIELKSDRKSTRLKYSH